MPTLLQAGTCVFAKGKPVQFFRPSSASHFVNLCVGALLAGLFSSSAQADFPEKAVRIVVPFAAGGGTDAVARTLGVGLAASLGQTVIIENKPGAGTIIGTDAVAKSAPDGYTLLMATFANAVNPSLMPSLPYSADTAFTPVVLIGWSPNILVVRADSPFKSVKDVIVAAQTNPGRLTYASQGNGTSAHLAGALFNILAKVDMTHVPYRGASPALTDLMGGQVDLMFATAAGAAPLLDSGKLRALGVTAAERSDARPDIPTIAESGVPGYVAQSWYGLLAPTGTPANVVARLNAAAAEAVKTEGFKTRVTEEGLVVSTGPPEQMETFVRNEEKRWSQVVRDAHITTN